MTLGLCALGLLAKVSGETCAGSGLASFFAFEADVPVVCEIKGQEMAQ